MMSYTYSQKKRGDAVTRKDGNGSQPSMDALRIGAAVPTREQMGRRVDLPEIMREKMENSFGADLSAVKLYESQAVEEAGAKAITQGSNIAFAPGVIDFTSFGGQKILGHEISHVVSQTRGEVRGSGFLNDHALESRADREGAMAAAGQQIAMPAAALSSATAAPAAGPMQAWGKNKDPGDTPAPKGISIDDEFHEYKDGPNQSTSVARVSANGGGNAVLKMGTNLPAERVLTKYHNTAGKTYKKRNGGKWGFDAPQVRGLTWREKLSMRLNGIIGKESGKFWSQKEGDRSTSDELNDAAVFSVAGGRSRVDPGTKEANVPGAISQNPTDPQEEKEYLKMMGFVAMTDMVTGNRDRLAGIYHMGNWTEERDKHQVHLIDNDYMEKGEGGLGVSAGQDKKDWMKKMVLAFGKGKREGNVGKKFLQQLYNPLSGATYSSDELKQFFRLDRDRTGSDAAVEGINDAVAALPEIREQLQQQFSSQKASKEEQIVQKEMLERLQISHEFLTDDRMSEIYERLSEIGFNESPDDDKSIKDERKRLLAEIQTRRAQKQAQQQQQQG